MKKVYRVTHEDEHRWVYGPYISEVFTLKEARSEAKSVLEKYPLSSDGYVKIEKVELVYTTETKPRKKSRS